MTLLFKAVAPEVGACSFEEKDLSWPLEVYYHPILGLERADPKC